MALSKGSQRLLALMALWRRHVKRVQVAGTLWPEASDAHAYASLRSELWRLRQVGGGVLEVAPADLTLAIGVHVDLDEASALAQRLVDPSRQVAGSDVMRSAVTLLLPDLLPGWYEDWALVEAERWRQLRLHALESIVFRLSTEGRHIEALDAALAVVAVDPLRESAQASLIQVHLREGNQCEALRAFRQYQELLRRELGLEPTERLKNVIRDLRKQVTPE